MRTVFFLTLLLTLFSCSDSDGNLPVGKWKYARLEKDGTVFLSDDEVEKRMIIDKHVRENADYIKDIAKFRKNAEKEMATRLDVFFDIKADSTVTVSDFTQGSDIQNWKYTVDNEAKTISFVTNDRTLTYGFKMENNKLFFEDKENKFKIALTRQEK